MEERKKGRKKEEEESGVKVRKHKDDERLENGVTDRARGEQLPFCYL